MYFPLRESIVAGCIAIDFILAGNAITQSFMTLPSLIADFPPQSSPEYAQRSALLGRQWPICWNLGNVVFRPISTISTLGYAATSVLFYRAGLEQWKWFAIGALLHVSVIVHSAVNMQPLNDALTSLAGVSSDGKEKVKQREAKDTVDIATKWIRGNYYRILVPFVSGSIAISNTVLAV